MPLELESPFDESRSAGTCTQLATNSNKPNIPSKWASEEKGKWEGRKKMKKEKEI